jgi:hypothetical protein
MDAQVLDGVDMEIETNCDHSDTGKRSNSPAVKLERRRRIEELNEQRFLKEEWGEF